MPEGLEPIFAQMIQQSVPGRRGEILAAALRVFSEHGYEAGSMREIAAKVGVTEPALYRHFASKEDIFLALIDEFGVQMHEYVVGPLLDTIEAADLRDRIIAIIGDRRQLLRQFAPAFTTIIASVVHNQVLLERYREAIIFPVRERLTATVERLDPEFGITDGEVDRASRVRSVMSLALGTFMSSIVVGDDPEVPAADGIMRVLRWG